MSESDQLSGSAYEQQMCQHNDPNYERQLLAKRQLVPFDSIRYWQQRYAKGGHSGDGSQHRLAAYKAKLVNALVLVYQIRSIVELGCGDGQQARLFEIPTYHGYDISPQALDRFRGGGPLPRNWSLHPLTARTEIRMAELALSLDVIYHLVEDEVYQLYMKQLLSASYKWLLVYSSDTEALGTMPHLRHRHYSPDITRSGQWRWVRDWNQPYAATVDHPRDNHSFAFFQLFKHV